ncbi:hypothetical protein [Neptunicella marina]|uniref:Solute-binding protein family 3/N-terminal domain-containing protein n=1 Tax=Neptunicella marina TaxID=2125989 RepID=A0A8J6IWG5_9ALTE|nr:hypothetical protein [Neptunicella marina]MBC3767489.1 hypothetical protein [Neptunicella marina]
MWINSPVGEKDDLRQSLHISQTTIDVIRHYTGDINFNVVSANNNRAFQLLDAHKNACASNKLKTTERQQQYLFTHYPQTVSAGLRLFVLGGSVLDKTLETKQSDNKPIELAKLFSDEHIRLLGVVGGRSYGNQLDALLNSPWVKSKLWSRTSSGMFVGVINMLSHNRIQAIVEYPSVVNRYVGQLASSVKLNSYAISEAADYGFGYIMCSNSVEGKRLIQQFDLAIKQAVKDPAFFDVHMNWNQGVSEQELRKVFHQVYAGVF